MRVLLVWPEKELRVNNLISELKKHGHDVVYWIGYKEQENYAPKETIFHFYQDAMEGKPAKNIDISDFLPASKEIIDKLYEAESIILTMMNRLFDLMGVNERKHLYYTMLGYWIGVIKKFKIDYIIFPNTPHFVYDYLIYELAHFFNIKMIAFDDTRIPGRLLYFEDFKKNSEVFQEELRKNKDKNFSLNDLSKDIVDYYKPRADRNYSDLPFYIKDQKKKESFTHWLIYESKIKKSIKNLSIFKKAAIFLFKKIKDDNFNFLNKLLIYISYFFRKNLKKEYESVQVNPDFNKNFIYVPLQNQPERTTSPQGDIFVDQILMMEILSDSIPKDWIIYAKEHPLQWSRWGKNFSNYRYEGYYKKLVAIKNVRIIPLKTSSYNLINQSKAVATITGSAAWEAALRSKPAIIFGHVWFQDCPGILKVDGVDSCKEAINKIKNGFSVNQQQIVNYLKCFEKATIRSYISPTAGKFSGLTKQESIDAISRLILSEIKK